MLSVKILCYQILGYPESKSTRFETAQEGYFCGLKGFFIKPYSNLKKVLYGSPAPSLLPPPEISPKKTPEMTDFNGQKVSLKS